MNDMTNEQLKAWAVEKLKNEGEDYCDGNGRSVELLVTPVLTIYLVANSFGYLAVDVYNGIDSVMHSESKEEYFYSALRIAYCCKEILGNGNK